MQTYLPCFESHKVWHVLGLARHCCAAETMRSRLTAARYLLLEKGATSCQTLRALTEQGPMQYKLGEIQAFTQYAFEPMHDHKVSQRCVRVA